MGLQRVGLGWRYFLKIFEEGGEVVGHALEHAGLLDIALEDFPHECAVVFWVDGYGLEGCGPGGFVFLEVGGIVDERECAGLVDEAELGDEAHGAAYGRCEGIVGGCGCGEGAVDIIGDVPV